MGWRRILEFCIDREVKLKPVEGLLIRRLLIGKQRKKLFRKLTNASFHMEEGHCGIWREESESPTREALSFFFSDHPLAWHSLPARGGDSLQMHQVVIRGHGVDSAQCL